MLGGRRRKEKQSSFFTYLGRQVEELDLHYLQKLTNRLALGVNISQRREGPFWEKAAPLFPEFLAGCHRVITGGAGMSAAGVSWVLP